MRPKPFWVAFLLAGMMSSVGTIGGTEGKGGGQSNSPAIRVTAVARPIAGDDIEVEVRVTVTPGHNLDLVYGSVPQVFGVYLLGPWGWAETNPPKINWMHQQVGPGSHVTIATDHPWAVRFNLSQFFEIGAITKGRSAPVQMNVKFLALECGMKEPVDSGALVVETSR